MIRFAGVLFLVLAVQAAGVEVVLTPGKEIGAAAPVGIQVKDGQLGLYALEDRFDPPLDNRFKIVRSPTYGEDELGVVDFGTDAAYISHQTRPDKCIFVECHDNDSASLARDVVPTVKGYVTFDIWPMRFWPMSGTVTATLTGDGGSISLPFSASDYKHAMTKISGGKTLSAPGGRPYFSSILTANIYVPSEAVPQAEQRWWNMRLTFRPAYIAGSLDGAVCREIEDPDKMPVVVRRVEIRVNQLETYIRTLRFKALLGEAVSTPIELKGGAWGRVSWQGTTPEKTRIGLQVRGADAKEALLNAPWQGPDAANPYFLAAGNVPQSAATKKFLQVKVLLKAEHDAPFESTPTVQSVTIEQKEAPR